MNTHNWLTKTFIILGILDILFFAWVFQDGLIDYSNKLRGIGEMVVFLFWSFYHLAVTLIFPILFMIRAKQNKFSGGLLVLAILMLVQGFQGYLVLFNMRYFLTNLGPILIYALIYILVVGALLITKRKVVT